MRLITMAAALLLMILAGPAWASTIISTLPAFNGTGSPGNTYIGTFSYSVPTGQGIVAARYTSSFGNSVINSSAIGQVSLDGITVGTCASSASSCYNTTTAINYSFLPSQFKSLVDGSADLYYNQTGCCVIRLGQSTLAIETAELAKAPSLSSQEKAKHADAALTARAKLATLDLFSSLASLGGKDVAEAVVNFLAQAAGSFDTPWATIVSTVTGILAAAFFGGPVGLALATTYAFMGAYYANVAAIEQRLANDPPDPNYSEVYQYSKADLQSLGVDPALQNYLEALVDGLGADVESRQGYLISLERAQGAHEGLDVNALNLQLEAMVRFKQDIPGTNSQLAGLLAQAPDIFGKTGVSNLPESDLVLATMQATSAELQVESAVPEPTTWATMIFGFGIVGFALRRRRHVRVRVTYS